MDRRKRCVLQELSVLRQRVPAAPDETEVESERRGGDAITEKDLETFMAEHNAKGVGLGMNQRSRDDYIYGGDYALAEVGGDPATTTEKCVVVPLPHEGTGPLPPGLNQTTALLQRLADGLQGGELGAELGAPSVTRELVSVGEDASVAAMAREREKRRAMRGARSATKPVVASPESSRSPGGPGSKARGGRGGGRSGGRGGRGRGRGRSKKGDADSLLSLSQRTVKPTDSQGDLSAIELEGSIATAEVKEPTGESSAQRGRVTLPSEVDARGIDWDDDLGFEVAARETLRNNEIQIKF